jgi:hypothetical protein
VNGNAPRQAFFNTGTLFNPGDIIVSPADSRSDAGLVLRMEEPGDYRADVRTHHVIFLRPIDRISLGCVLVALCSLQALGFLVSV